nr:uncharacterized protein LOC131798998 [Pocillopora verrucosa]
MEERKPLNSASALNVEDSDSRSRHHSTAKKLKVTFLARGWNELRDETEIIKEIAKYMAKSSEVTITILVPECNDEDKEAAKRQNINLVMADKKIGFAGLDFLSWAPKEMSIDIVVGSDIELGRRASAIRDSRSPDCKWVQFVHRSHEDIEKHKENSNRTETEEKHNIEVQLCKSSDSVVTIGPKVHETFCSYLRPYEKDEHVYNFTPGILTELSGLRQSQKELKYFRVVCFFSGDLKDFDLQGLDIAAEAVATLRDCRLLFVGALDGMQDETKKRFVECGIDPKFFVIRSVIHTQEKLKKVLLEADLAIMPSREEGFGFKLLKALSAGLPILVSSNSGLAEALRRIPFGPNFVVSSDDSGAWAEAIDSIRKKDRCTRLKESGKLRLLYQEMYSWEKQCKTLLQNIFRFTNGMNFDNDHDDHREHYYDAEEETENPQAGESVLTRRPVQNFGSRTSKGATAKLANESPSVNKEIAVDGDGYGDTALQNFGSRTSKGATAKLANESPSVNKEIAADGDGYGDTAAHIPKFPVNPVTEEIPQNGMNYFIVA